MIYAYEFLARDRAGLALCGRDDDGELEWVGTDVQWANVERLEAQLSSI